MNIYLALNSVHQARVQWVFQLTLESLGYNQTDAPEKADAVLAYNWDLGDFEALKAPVISLNDQNESQNWSLNSKFKGVEYIEGLPVPKHLSFNGKGLFTEDGRIGHLELNLIPFLYYWCSNDFYKDIKERDSLGRLTFQLSGFDFNDIARPHLNEWAKFIDLKLQKLLKAQEQPYFRKHFWPNHAPAAAVYSHDVDIVDHDHLAYWRAFIGAILRRDASVFDFFLAAVKMVFGSFLGKKSPYRNFQLDQVSKHHESNGIKASFNIIASEYGKRDNAPYLRNFKDEIYDLHRKGHEIGLHGGYESTSYINGAQLKAEKEYLEKTLKLSIDSTRQHYLGYNHQHAIQNLEDANIKIDTSVAYPDAPGIKSGLVVPYPMFQEDQQKQVIQLPLILMDGTLMSRVYSGLSLSKAFDKFRHFKAQVKQHQGVLTVNWHQRVFSEGPFRKWMILYRRIVKELQEEGFYINHTAAVVNRFEMVQSTTITVHESELWINSEADITDFSFYTSATLKQDENLHKLEDLESLHRYVVPRLEKNKILKLQLASAYAL